MIDFSADNWFEQYLNYRKENPVRPVDNSAAFFAPAMKEISRFESTNNRTYELLQYSGLVYGFPVRYPFQPPPLKKKKKNVVGLTLVDLILHSSILEEETNGAYREMVEMAGQRIREYYRQFIRYQGQPAALSIENMLLRRVRFKKSLLDFRKTGINSHLFWDWYFVQEYIHLEKPPQDSTVYFDRLLNRQRQMKLLTLKLVSAAIHSDGRISKPERILQHQLRNSSRLLTESEKNKARKFLTDPVSLKEIVIPELNWTARRFLLDVCVLAVFADREIDIEEERFLEELIGRLRLSREDLLESKVKLGIFLYQYGKKLNFYNKQRNSIALITMALGDNFKNLRRATRMEYQETVEMAAIFGSLLKTQLRIGNNPRVPSEEEIIYAFEQLKDIPKFLPFFSFIFVPVPGVTELYILLAYSIEKMTGNSIRLLPSQFSKMVKGRRNRKT